jgi:hypothetical protein
MADSLRRSSQLSVSWQRLFRASLYQYFVGYKSGTCIGHGHRLLRELY